jgi:hypothetical protein
MTTEAPDPTPDPTPDLARLGDDLERAAGDQLAVRRRRTRALRTAGGLAAVALMLTATAAMAGLFTPKQVAASLPASAVIFGNTHPACALDADGSTFHCTLDTAPQSDTTGLTPVPGKGATDKPAGPDVVADYTGWKEPIGIDGVVAGGCLGRSADGLSWDCYIGQDAVDQLIISRDFLGEPMLGPGRG